MPTWAWVLIIIGAAVVLVLLVAALAFRQRRRRLQERFGPEYGRTVERAGGRRAAEAELRERERKREQLDIVPLSPDARDRYLSDWRAVQARFVDEPSQSLVDADRLVTQVMRDRGYPMDDFERRADDVSVDHPHVVENYRAAQVIYLADQRGGATTEQLRQAVVHYRALFAELLETADETEHEEAERGAGGAERGATSGRDG